MTIKHVSVSDVADAQLGLLPCKVKALKANPHSSGDQQIAAVVGFEDGKVAGSEVVFPLCLKLGDKVVRVLAGSGLNVKTEFRKSGLGLELPELRWKATKSKIGIGAGLSQMALPVHQFCDYTIFLLPRQIMLCKSRSVVEMKLHGVMRKIVSTAVDFAIWIYACLLNAVKTFKLMGVEFREVLADDLKTLEQIAALIAADSHPYAEVHDAGWLKWHMSESFSERGGVRVFVMEKRGTMCGFYMVKSRFHEQASHRGFKNVWLGSVIEWDCRRDMADLQRWMLVRAALQMRKEGMDAVEIANDDLKLQKFLTRMGWRMVGEGNFAIKCGEGSGYEHENRLRQQENWRLRPAMGDNGIT